MDVSSVVSDRREKRTCDEERCIGCAVIEDCEDSSKLIRNMLRERMSGKHTHAEFVKELNSACGPIKKRMRKGWRQILGDKERFYIDLYKLDEDTRQTAIKRMTISELADLHSLNEQLVYHGYYMPYVITNEHTTVDSLKFSSIHRQEPEDADFPHEE
jgi:hypothetical protein